MITRQYPTSRFAAKAGVTLRTLRYYGQIGLLQPSFVTQAGHRRYTDRDLIRLQQILALKFLGFSLDQIRQMLRIEPLEVGDSLEIQKRMMAEKREQIDAVIRAIERAQELMARQGKLDWESLVQVIKATQMEKQTEWWKKYYSEEAWKKIEERQRSYSKEQAEADARRWQEVIEGMREAARRGDDPGSPAVQDLARRWTGLVNEFTMGDPEIERGLAKLWADPQMPYQGLYDRSGPEGEFIRRALGIYEGK